MINVHWPHTEGAVTNRLPTAEYAEMLVMAFMGVAEFEDLEPADQAHEVAKMAAAIDFLGSQGHIIVPTSMAPGALS